MEEFIVDYFKNIAIQLKMIGHTEVDPAFFYIKDFTDPSSVNEAIRKLKAGLILVLEAPEGLISSNDADNDMDIKAGAFTLLKRANGEDEKNEFKDLFDEVQTAALKIFSRMRKDRSAEVFDYCTQELNYQKVGPVADNRYGRRYEFRIGRCVETTYNEEDWTE